jgi:hypothetical protein
VGAISLSFALLKQNSIVEENQASVRAILLAIFSNRFGISDMSRLIHFIWENIPRHDSGLSENQMGSTRARNMALDIFLELAKAVRPGPEEKVFHNNLLQAADADWIVSCFARHMPASTIEISLQCLAQLLSDPTGL